MRRAAWIALVIVVLTGCSDVGPSEEEYDLFFGDIASVSYKSATTGTIAGTVHWTGPVPAVPPIKVTRFSPDATRVDHLSCVNPHGPTINAEGQVTNAIVFLRGVDLKQAKPWDHPPVTVMVADGQPMVRQGEAGQLVGFVRRGDRILLVSKQPIFHAVRARGAAFFTFTLPDPDRPRERVLAERGRVELSSAASQMALRGHIFVDDHPYYTRTDANGRFQLEQVPAGNYELVCWRPNWNIERIEHDPETLLNARLYYQQPFEKVANVTVEEGGTATVNFDVGAN